MQIVETPKEYEHAVRVSGKLIDSGFAGGMAGMVGANIGRTMFADGGKLMRVGSVNKLSLGFMVSRGIFCGLIAGAVEVAVEEIEERYLKEDFVEVVAETGDLLKDRNTEDAETGKRKTGEELKEELKYYRKLLGKER